MTQAGFIPMLEGQLALLGVLFERAELLAWPASVWPYIADDPDSVR